MSLKAELITLLESNRDDYLSGQEMAEKMGVSRAAVWKEITVLRKDGYIVEAIPNRGYRLSSGSDCLSEEGVRVFLDCEYKNNRILVLPTVNSTNTYAKQLSLLDGKHGDIVIANSQTQGKGRFGRTFVSPADTGIYMSILLKPKMALSEAVHFTVTAAVATCLAIEECTDKKPSIKWVNDIFIDNKKVCGILCEAVSDCETNQTDCVVVGIGINVKMPIVQFPEDVRAVATSLGEQGAMRNRLVASVVNHFMHLMEHAQRSQIMKQYKSRSIIIGKQISYTKDAQQHQCRVLDMNDDANLIVEDADGRQTIIQSGEVTIGSK